MAEMAWLLMLAATASVPRVSPLTCYDCMSGGGGVAAASRAGKQPCDGAEQDWHTCSVDDDAGSCLLLEQGKQGRN